jgi:hypothetical protein
MRNLVSACLLYVVSFNLYALTFDVVERQSCDSKASFVEIFPHNDQSKPDRRIEMIENAVHLFNDSIPLARTYTDPENPSIQIIRSADGETLGRIQTEVIPPVPGRHSFIQYSLVSENGEIVASLGQQPWASRTEIYSDKALWFRATELKNGTWQVQIYESQKVDDVPLFLLFAWHRTQFLTPCWPHIIFDGFVANLPYIAPCVFGVVTLTFMGWWWKQKNPGECPIKFPCFV